jgi:hypothetical protein
MMKPDKSSITHIRLRSPVLRDHGGLTGNGSAFAEVIPAMTNIFISVGVCIRSPQTRGTEPWAK